jgi:hypothetical protein
MVIFSCQTQGHSPRLLFPLRFAYQRNYSALSRLLISYLPDCREATNGLQITGSQQLYAHRSSLHTSHNPSCVASRTETATLLMGKPCISMTAAEPVLLCWGRIHTGVDDICEVEGSCSFLPCRIPPNGQIRLADLY